MWKLLDKAWETASESDGKMCFCGHKHTLHLSSESDGKMCFCQYNLAQVVTWKERDCESVFLVPHGRPGYVCGVTI